MIEDQKYRMAVVTMPSVVAEPIPQPQHKIRPKKLIIRPVEDGSGQWHVGLIVKDEFGNMHYFLGRMLKLSQFEFDASLSLVEGGEFDVEPGISE